MFRQKDTLDMHVCNKKYFTIYIYIYVQVAKYLMKKKTGKKNKNKQGKEITNKKRKKREKRKISCLAEKPTCF